MLCRAVLCFRWHTPGRHGVSLVALVDLVLLVGCDNDCGRWRHAHLPWWDCSVVSSLVLASMAGQLASRGGKRLAWAVGGLGRLATVGWVGGTAY